MAKKKTKPVQRHPLDFPDYELPDQPVIDFPDYELPEMDTSALEQPVEWDTTALDKAFGNMQPPELEQVVDLSEIMEPIDLSE